MGGYLPHIKRLFVRSVVLVVITSRSPILLEVSMGGYLPHINRLFVCFCGLHSELFAEHNGFPTAHADFYCPTDAGLKFLDLAWSLRRCQCDDTIALCEVATHTYLRTKQQYI
jgi:hypothetical protein